MMQEQKTLEGGALEGQEGGGHAPQKAKEELECSPCQVHLAESC